MLSISKWYESAMNTEADNTLVFSCYFHMYCFILSSAITCKCGGEQELQPFPEDTEAQKV